MVVLSNASWKSKDFLTLNENSHGRLRGATHVLVLNPEAGQALCRNHVFIRAVVGPSYVYAWVLLSGITT